MSFQFPDPNVQDTVINPLTGSKYQWIDPPGKWTIVVSSNQISDIIYEGDSPPDPRGDYKLWYSTDTLELYFWYEDINGNGAWVPTAAPITMLEDLETDVQLALAKAGVAEAAANANLTTIGLLDQALTEVENSLGKVTLQEVLTNGNIADQTIELTDGTDDLIVIRPEEALIGIASDLEAKKPRFRLAHIDKMGYPDSHAQWEIDDDGTRNDIDLGGNIKALHVRFDDQETFTLDKTGNAEFTGNLQLDKKLYVDGKASFKDAVKILPNEDSGKYSLTVYGRVDGYHDNALLIATNNDWFRKIDDCVEYFGTSVSDESLVTKKYVDDHTRSVSFSVDETNTALNALTAKVAELEARIANLGH